MRSFRLLFFFAVACAVFPPATAARADTLTLAVVKLGDISGYRGSWKIDRHMTRLLANGLSSLAGIRLSDPADVSQAAADLMDMPDQAANARKLLMVGRAVGADLVLGGTVREFRLEGQSVSAYRTAGVERFVAQVDLSLTLVDVRSGAVILDQHRVPAQEVDRDIGLAILGGPGNRPTEEILRDVWNSPIDSDLVRMSVLGRTMGLAVSEAAARITLAISGVAAGREGRVVRVRGQDAYVNLGSEDHLQPGDVLIIWPNVEVLRDPRTSAMIGFTRAGEGAEVEVVEVRGARLCVARLEDPSLVREGDVVRVVGGYRDGKWTGRRLSSARR